MTTRSYRAWIAELDGLCDRYLGLGLYDLEDMPMREWFDDELTPREAFDELRDQLTEYGFLDCSDYGGAFDGFTVTSDADPGL